MTNIKNCLLLLAIGLVILSCNKEDDTAMPDNDITIPDGYELVWSDEFNDNSIDRANWVYETGDGTDYGLPAGWGNDELQIYTEDPENSGIEADGELSVLYVRALRDGSGGFTSAKLTTNDLFSMRFGRIDVKAKMPRGQGIWPAIWLLGDNNDQIDWPGCGEIDIVELLGNEPDKIYTTLHYTNSENRKGEVQESYQLPGETFSDSYHVFSLDWTPDELIFSMDGIEIQRVPIESDMKEFLRSFYLILNVAVGGNWPGYPDNTTTFPQSMYVDYVRVFEKIGFEAPAAPVLDVEEETFGQDIEPTLAQHAIKDGFEELGNASILIWGGGGEPVISSSDLAVDGDSSLVLDYPGGNWGGAFMELENPADLSNYTHLRFSLHQPASLTDAEIKLESPTTDAAVYLVNYSGVETDQGFLEYSIPLSDFTGLDLTNVSIPFSVWNPKDSNEAFTTGAVHVDQLYFAN